eukprot:4947876-Pyramimonas_sp.AAC.1
MCIRDRWSAAPGDDTGHCVVAKRSRADRILCTRKWLNAHTQVCVCVCACVCERVLKPWMGVRDVSHGQPGPPCSHHEESAGDAHCSQAGEKRPDLALTS